MQAHHFVAAGALLAPCLGACHLVSGVSDFETDVSGTGGAATVGQGGSGPATASTGGGGGADGQAGGGGTGTGGAFDDSYVGLPGCFVGPADDFSQDAQQWWRWPANYGGSHQLAVTDGALEIRLRDDGTPDSFDWRGVYRESASGPNADLVNCAFVVEIPDAGNEVDALVSVGTDHGDERYLRIEVTEGRVTPVVRDDDEGLKLTPGTAVPAYNPALHRWFAIYAEEGAGDEEPSTFVFLTSGPLGPWRELWRVPVAYPTRTLGMSLGAGARGLDQEVTVRLDNVNLPPGP
ncbi:MAG: hypothetical protein AAF928_20810 [Myxococcota bacterium]